MSEAMFRLGIACLSQVIGSRVDTSGMVSNASCDPITHPTCEGLSGPFSFRNDNVALMASKGHLVTRIARFVACLAILLIYKMDWLRIKCTWLLPYPLRELFLIPITTASLIRAIFIHLLKIYIWSLYISIKLLL